MNKGMIVGGGGANPLNFKVVGGLEEPANPKDQTLWIKTDVKITGYHFASVAPNAPEEGCVWISTWIKSPQAFNALKKNTLMVYPNYCKQYVNGEWVSREMLVRFGAEWVSTTRYLLTDGNMARPFTLSSGLGYPSQGDGYIYVGANTSYYGEATYLYMYPDPVDLSAFKTLKADAYAVKEWYGGSGSLVVCTDVSGGIAASVGLTLNAWATSSLDISALEGEYYIGFYGAAKKWATTGDVGADGGHIYAKNLWLEP